MRALAVLWFMLVGHAAVGGELPVGEWECSGKSIFEDGSVMSYRYTNRVSVDGSFQYLGEDVWTDLESDAKATLKSRWTGKYRAVGSGTLLVSIDQVDVLSAKVNRGNVFDLNYLVKMTKEIEGGAFTVDVLSLTESEFIVALPDTGEAEICLK